MPAVQRSHPEARRYETLEAAAERLACSVRTVRRMIAEGDLTGYRIGKRMLRVDTDELDRLARIVPSGGGAA